MTFNALELVAAFAIALAVGWIIGWFTGYEVAFIRGKKRGRDEQWVECFLAAEKRGKARREKDGRFKSKTK
jgi:hypothetical protein